MLRGDSACSEVTSSMRPRIRLFFMCRPRACIRMNAASRLTESISRHCASVALSTVSPSCRRGLALCTKIDTVPSLRIASPASERAPAGVDRSHFTSDSAMSARRTFAPSCSSASAMPLPMPRAAPVTSARSPSRSFTSGASLQPGFRALRREALARLGRLDHEAHVGSPADFLDAVLHGKPEYHLAPVDLGDLHADFDFQPHGRGGEMVDRDVRADRVLARVEVLQQEVAAGVLDVA